MRRPIKTEYEEIEDYIKALEKFANFMESRVQSMQKHINRIEK